MRNDKYFALRDKENLGASVIEKADKFVQYCLTTGLKDQWDESWIMYHNHRDGFNRGINTRGEVGELSKVVINEMRSIIQNILSMTTQNRPDIQARAINADVASLQLIRIYNGIFEYYMREKQIEEKLKDTAEDGLVRGSGYTVVRWNPFLGEMKVRDGQGKPVYEGDLEVLNADVLSVFFDPNKKRWEDNDWVILREFINKYELAERYPKYAEEIINRGKTKMDSGLVDYQYSSPEVQLNSNMFDETDDIEIFTLYHRKCLLVPEGKQTIMLSDGFVLEDGDLPYREIPVYKLSPAKFIGSQIGYGSTLDLQGPQEVIDATYSMLTTNIMTFGLSNVAIPTGTSINRQDVQGGLNVLEIPNDAKMPQTLNLLNIPPEMFNMAEFTRKSIETLSGVNSVARGNPEASLRSGNALALVHAMALQFNSGMENAYAKHIEQVGTAMLRVLADNIKTKKNVHIMGERNSYTVEALDEQALSKFDRFVVDITNPLMRTTAGRLQVADTLMQQEKIEVHDYITILRTGQLDHILDDKSSITENLQKENQALLKGIEVPVLPLDNHPVHIMRHQSLLNDPHVRNNRELSDFIFAHIQEHMLVWKQMSIEHPDMLAAVGIPPLQPQVGMMPEETQGLQDADVDAAQAESAQLDQIIQQQEAIPEEALPDVPQPPPNPLTGE